MSGLDPRGRLLIGDACQQLARLAPGSVDMVLTSPPYPGQPRDYGHRRQLGQVTAVTAWVEQIAAVSAAIARVLAPHGSYWLNLGDAYAATPRQGAPRKSLLLAPERLLLRLSEDGWLVRNKIVWAKPNPLPSAVRDRLTASWEPILLLTRRPRYFFDLDAVRRPVRGLTRPPGRPDHPGPPARRERPDWQGRHGDAGAGLRRMQAHGLHSHPAGANPGDVWTIPTSAGRHGHHATFPIELARRAIRAGCPEGCCPACRTPWRRPLIRQLGGRAVRGSLRPNCDCPPAARPGLVLDPFLGSGTTALAAIELGRDWAGIELNPDYAALAARRIRSARHTG